MKTFDIAFKNGDPSVSVSYTPIRVQVGNKRHDLALHKLLAGWQVSDPVSGSRVCHVYGLYRGVRVSSKGFTQREAKALAIAHVQACAERVGIDHFNAVISASKTTT